MIYHIVAMAKNRVIGNKNKLPWHFSADLKHFKELTKGSTVIMGRKTFESIGKPLPERENFVMTQRRTAAEGKVRYFGSIEEALKQVSSEHAFIIGGASIYEQTLDKIDGIYLTQIDAAYEGDAFYPAIPASFKEKSRDLLQNNPKLEVIFYERIRTTGGKT